VTDVILQTHREYYDEPNHNVHIHIKHSTSLSFLKPAFFYGVKYTHGWISQYRIFVVKLEKVIHISFLFSNQSHPSTGRHILIAPWPLFISQSFNETIFWEYKIFTDSLPGIQQRQITESNNYT